MLAFKAHDLWGVLACRLYLKVTMLSEIVDDTGQYIESWAMYGERQSNTTIQYPYQPKPPEGFGKPGEIAYTRHILGQEGHEQLPHYIDQST